MDERRAGVPGTGAPTKSALRDGKGSVREHRRNPRKACRVEARYECEGQPYLGHVIDIGLGGLCLETRYSHALRDRLSLIFDLFPTRERPLSAQGKVVTITRLADGLWGVGIKFDPLERAAEKDVFFYVLN